MSTQLQHCQYGKEKGDGDEGLLGNDLFALPVKVQTGVPGVSLLYLHRKV